MQRLMAHRLMVNKLSVLSTQARISTILGFPLLKMSRGSAEVKE